MATSLGTQFRRDCDKKVAKATVAVASVSQAHATSVGRRADLRFATTAIYCGTHALWHAPRQYLESTERCGRH